MTKRQAVPPQGLTRKQVSRAKREARIQRAVLIGTILVAVTVVGLVGYAILNTTVLEPRKTIASVGDDKISVADYQNRVLFEYFLYSIQPFNQQQFNPFTVLDQMVEELVVQRRAAEMGISVSDADVTKELQLLVGYDAGEPEPTSTPFPTIARSDATSTATATYVFTLTPSPTATLAPGVTPTEVTPTTTVTATPRVSPTPTQTVTPGPTSTPITEADYEERINQFLEQGAQAVGLPVAVMQELWRERTYNDLIRRRVSETVNYDIAQTKTLIHAAHILVATKEEADAILDRIASGESFETLAAELSLDSSNSYKGGDLGWFGAGRMVPEFEDAAFAVPVGEISPPVQTQFGWHLIKTYDKAEEPTNLFDQESQRQSELTAMIAQWRSEENVVIDENYPTYAPTLPQLQGQ